jgi:hypothetical protein
MMMMMMMMMMMTMTTMMMMMMMMMMMIAKNLLYFCQRNQSRNLGARLPQLCGVRLTWGLKLLERSSKLKTLG